MVRVGGEGEQGAGRCPEKDRIQRSSMTKGERIQRRRDGEDEMEIPDGQQFLRPRRQPFGLRHRLALRTMAVAAGVVRNLQVSALVATIDVSSQGRRSTGGDRVEHAPLLSRRSRPVPFAIRLRVSSEDFSEVVTPPCHRAGFRADYPVATRFGRFYPSTR